MEKEMTIRDGIRAFINDQLIQIDKIGCNYERFLSKSGVYNTIRDIADDLHEELCNNRYNLTNNK